MTLQELDENLLKLVNLNHSSEYLDNFMILVSDHVFLATPVITLALYFAFTKNWKSIKLLIFMIIGVGLLDSICTFLIKVNFQRLRPCKAHEWVNVVYKCGGRFGYVSNHAANSFASMTYIFLRIKADFRWVLYLFAFLVAFSRVYLGVHYPFDVFSGAVLGTFWAYVTSKIFIKLGGNSLLV